MRAQEPIEIAEGQTLLIIVQGDRVVDHDAARRICQRSVGELPEGAWVGTISKIGGDLAVISSKSSYGYQLPAPEWVTKTVKAAFK